MALPNPSMDFDPLDTLTAAEMDDIVENIEALAAGTAISGIYKNNLTVDSNPYKFSVYRNANQAVSTGVATKIQLDTEEFDTNNNFDNAANFRYVAPVAGFYFISGKVSNNGNGGFNVYIYKNGTIFKELYVITIASGRSGGGGGILLPLAATDYVELWVVSDNTTMVGGANATYMSGFLVSRT